jgi:hypothetical protein
MHNVLFLEFQYGKTVFCVQLDKLDIVRLMKLPGYATLLQYFLVLSFPQAN